MKKLKTTIPDGGAPLGEFPVIRKLFDEENKNAIEALLYSITEGETEGVILKGCEVTGTAGDFDIAEGYIYCDGEVLYYAGGTTFAATQYLELETPTEESGTFADAVSRAFIDVRQASEFASAGGGAGTQYVTIAHGATPRTLKDALGDSFVGIESSTPALLTKVIEIGDWNMDTDGSILVTNPIGDKDKIRNIEVMIRPDVGVFLQFNYKLDRDGAGFIDVGSTNIVLARTGAGLFDSADFDSTSYNRGWIALTYEK